MKYFYIFPFRPQYYFPGDVREYPFLLSFFTPYTLQGSVIWWICRKTFFFKFFFAVDESEVPDLKTIKNCIGNNVILAINRGTIGPEQKTTAIGYFPDNNKKFFIKYAVSEKAKILVINEYAILLKLREFTGIPQITKYQIDHSGILLQTDFIEGDKLQDTILTEKIRNLMLRLSKISTEDCQDYAIGFDGRKCFGHGDLCPWNILVSGNNLHLIDWEMAGSYPAGYDLFTYLFQTQFILNPERRVREIIYQNFQYIQAFFSELGIASWESFLTEFARFKFEYNKEKSPALAKKFSELL